MRFPSAPSNTASAIWAPMPAVHHQHPAQPGGSTTKCRCRREPSQFTGPDFTADIPSHKIPVGLQRARVNRKPPKRHQQDRGHVDWRNFKLMAALRLIRISSAPHNSGNSRATESGFCRPAHCGAPCHPHGPVPGTPREPSMNTRTRPWLQSRSRCGPAPAPWGPAGRRTGIGIRRCPSPSTRGGNMVPQTDPIAKMTGLKTA